MKKIVYIDMDNVLVDFKTGIEQLDPQTIKQYGDDLDDVPGIFGLMKPMSGAIDAVKTLSKYYTLYILSTAPWNNPSAWSDKVKWIQKYFGMEEGSTLYKKLIISHNKQLNRGNFLIDDRTKNGASEFEGELVLFGSNKFPDWEFVTNYMIQLYKESEIILSNMWNGYCPESFLLGKKTRMRLNTSDFYESEETGLQICILKGVQAIILNKRGDGNFTNSPSYADEIELGEVLSPQNTPSFPFNTPTEVFKNSSEIETYIESI